MMPLLWIGLLGIVAVPTAVYLLVSHLWLARWLREERPAISGGAELPAVTFLRPMKRDTPRVRENIGTLLAAMRAGDQLVIGVDEEVESSGWEAEWRAAFPEREICVVLCARGAALNPKISKLLQMTPHARHEYWILADSEAQIDGAFLENFRAEWYASGAAAITCGYRFVGATTLPQRLDAAAVLLTLWPGLAWLRRCGAVRLTLGACTGLRRSDVEEIGGWRRFAAELAEDHRIGVALTAAGKRVRLSREIVTLESDRLSWRDYWRHQRRVAVTYRVSDPIGYACSIVTHGVSLSLLVAAVAPAAWRGFAVAVAVALWVLRWCAAAFAEKLTGSRIPALPFAVLIGSLVETLCWCASWLSRRLWWAGQEWRVNRAGQLELQDCKGR